MAQASFLKPFSDPWLFYDVIRAVVTAICFAVTAIFLISILTEVPGPLASLYSVLRALTIFLDMVVIFVTIFAGVELFSMRPKFVHDPRKPSPGHKAKAAAGASAWENWQKIRAKLDAATPESVRIAVIEADGFVDNVLKQRGYAGETFADRLANIKPHSMETLDRLWDAHRLRNDIVHTHGFEVSEDTARIALNNYEAFLHELGALTPPIASALKEKEEEEEAKVPGAFTDDD